jgi:co-chaperonin GroES (HSP10)
MNFRPLRDLILVKPDPSQDKTDSGIVIPQGVIPDSERPGEALESYRDSFIGTVVAVGPGDRVPPFNWEKCWKCKKPRVACYLDYFRCGCGDFMASEIAKQAADWAAQGERYPMYIQRGDRVIYPRRPNSPGGDCDVHIDGELYVMFHEQQSGFALLEAE